MCNEQNNNENTTIMTILKKSKTNFKRSFLQCKNHQFAITRFCFTKRCLEIVKILTIHKEMFEWVMIFFLIQLFVYFCSNFCFAKSSIVFAFEACVFHVVDFVALLFCRVAKFHDRIANDVSWIRVCFESKQIRCVYFSFSSKRRQRNVVWNCFFSFFCFVFDSYYFRNRINAHVYFFWFEFVWRISHERILQKFSQKSSQKFSQMRKTWKQKFWWSSNQRILQTFWQKTKRKKKIFWVKFSKFVTSSNALSINQMSIEILRTKWATNLFRKFASKISKRINISSIWISRIFFLRTSFFVSSLISSSFKRFWINSATNSKKAAREFVDQSFSKITSFSTSISLLFCFSTFFETTICKFRRFDCSNSKKKIDVTFDRLFIIFSNS